MKTYDDRQRRCPRLGNPITFEYCRSSEGGQPCFKIMDCWWETFDIAAYIEANFPEEIFRKLAEAKPKPKVNQLLELIEAAKRRAEQK